MAKRKYFAIVRWMIDDVQTRRPDWTEEQCKTWLEKNERALEDMLTEYGNGCLDQMLEEVTE